MSAFDHVTTESAVKTYEAAKGVFTALLDEVRELSRKKPEATLSASKVKLINALLVDLLTFLEKEPEGKYLHALDDSALSQTSDALMMMVQFEAALSAYKKRYYRSVSGRGYSSSLRYWITEEQLSEWGSLDEDSDFDDGDSQ